MNDARPAALLPAAIDSPLHDRIDLACHGVVEAHAGTGKTYTIVKTVLRILRKTVSTEKGTHFVHIRNVLLVTFTDKAAGELKRRIREGIEEDIRELQSGCSSLQDERLRRHLENCLNNFHEALIGTIHAVCLRLLQTWPFETGVHFNTEMVDDDTGLESALRESMRTDWQRPDTCIPWALEQLEKQGMQLEENHFALIRKTAKELLDEEGVVLDRTSIGGFGLPVVRNVFERRPKDYLSTECGRDFIEKVKACIACMERILADPRDLFTDDILSEFRRRIAGWEAQMSGTILTDSFMNLKTYNGSKLINTARTRKHPLFGVLLEFHEAIPSHPLLKIFRCETILPALICDASELLAVRWNRTKYEQGLISFNDMLRLMYKAVQGECNPFVAHLQGLFQYGIIDEFQDTSALQWRIFEKIFLCKNVKGKEHGSRLIIVGDPKQSIYSFQGADVGSYLDAKKTITEHGGTVYPLTENYRSLPGIIDACNSIFGPDTGGNDWFAFDEKGEGGISYPSEGNGGDLAKPPDRSHPSLYELTASPVQVMPLSGGAPARRGTMARWTSMAIRHLRGKKVTIPDGSGWKETVLDYKDFAVIVETHKIAEPFLEQFQNDGIPVVKYKMEGVFQSPMARDIHALLRAVLKREGDPAPRLAALLTHFFNRHPASIDAEHDLEPCSDRRCRGDTLCIYHALEEWSYLAEKRYWARLFGSIRERTGIRERILVKLRDGERRLADLKQVSEYCLEKLYRDNFSLEQLVEHLRQLYNEEIEAGRDRNLHVLATNRSSVKILTMHAAKGLEFPVVFAAAGGSRTAPGKGNVLSWIDGDRRKHVIPLVAPEDTRTAADQRKQERRRLLYVALTRVQALLFIPMHLAAGKDRHGAWTGIKRPSYYPDNDLTVRLQELLDAGTNDTIQVFDEKDYSTPADSTAATEPLLSTPAVTLAGIPSMNLLESICRQTSYSRLSRKISSSRDVDRSEEDEELETEIMTGKKKEIPALPGGRMTGDALHLALEELLKLENMRAFLARHDETAVLVNTFLERNGIMHQIDEKGKREHETSEQIECKKKQAVETALTFIKGALQCSLKLPGMNGGICIADIPRNDRIPEMEFYLGVKPHWVHGYMDLVFRTPVSGAKHPYRYHILDWKSDQLGSFDCETIERCIEERHYSLQAKLYCHALDKYLEGVLGDAYSPEQNLGGAVYVFLRSFDEKECEGAVHTWVRKADREDDARFSEKMVKG